MLRRVSALTLALFSLFTTVVATSTRAQTPPPPAAIEKGIVQEISKVPPFQFIQARAKELGLRAWLFGGTASALAHYVKQDLQHQTGDTRFPPTRFDSSVQSIYFPGQDLDLVVDGPDDSVQTLESELREKFPFLQGDRSAWEVRGLRRAKGRGAGAKAALLDNPDFLNQHSDSHSTVLIELTSPPAREPRVRDIRNWKRRHSEFLNDVAYDTIHYYHSPNHETTQRAKDGLNPPILSVIRLLTKSAQYGLTLRSADLKAIRPIIEAFDPNSIRSNSYLQGWVEKNAKKLILHSTDIEGTWDLLETLGLRKKLIAISPDSAGTEESLTWWLSKEPLRTRPLGQAQAGETAGKTAKELGISEVAHQTRTFEAYESLTRSPRGRPNALISRKGTRGEAASYGNGFYVAIGTEGDGSSDMAVRFRLHPQARQGVDFLRPPNVPKFLVIRNRAALQVIPESLVFGPAEYLGWLNDYTPRTGDQGLLTRQQRKLETQIAAMNEAERSTLTSSVLKLLERHPSPAMARAWFSLPQSADYPELMSTYLLNSVNPRNDYPIDSALLKLPHWRAYEASDRVARELIHSEDNGVLTAIWKMRFSTSYDRQQNRSLFLTAASVAPEWQLSNWINHNEAMSDRKSAPVLIAQCARFPNLFREVAGTLGSSNYPLEAKSYEWVSLARMLVERATGTSTDLVSLRNDLFRQGVPDFNNHRALWWALAYPDLQQRRDYLEQYYPNYAQYHQHDRYPRPYLEPTPRNQATITVNGASGHNQQVECVVNGVRMRLNVNISFKIGN